MPVHAVMVMQAGAAPRDHDRASPRIFIKNTMQTRDYLRI
jgi:hypothetical protein